MNNNSIKPQPKPAPANVLAEKALLSAIIIDLSVKNMQEAEILTIADFYDSRHRQIFARMKELYDAGKAVDLVGFAGSEYEDYLLEIMELPEGLLHIGQYIETIKEESIKRQRLSLIDDFKENKITYDDLINSLQKLYVAKKEPIRTSELIKNIKPINEQNIFGIKILYGAVFTLAGATSAGKTEFSLEIADVHAKQADCVSIYCVFEGGINEFGLRLKKKTINNENLYMLHNPGISDIKNAVHKFSEKGKKVLVIIDYLQMFARRLQANDNKPADFLRKYTSYIYTKIDELRTKYNVCFCFLSALNNQGIHELMNLRNFDSLRFLTSMKEDGNISYDMDYVYAMLFATETEKVAEDWSLGRTSLNTMRKYILLHPAKPSRIGEDTKDALYVYDAESGRYNRLEFKDDDENCEEYSHKNKGRPRGIKKGQL